MAASALATVGDPQKQLLSIIRDFAAEKSHGERTVSGLKRRLDDVLVATDAATAELEAAKQAREVAETDLRGRQVQASIATASIQALETSISHLQEEISKVSSDLDVLKTKADSEREEFLSQMHELNARIRKFQQMISVESTEKCSGLPPADGNTVSEKNENVDSEGVLKDLVDKVSNIEAKVCVLDAEYQRDLINHEKLCQVLAEVQAKRALMEAVMGDTKQVQDLGRQTAELEKVHASLAEELQRQYVCPGCGANNMVGLEEATPMEAN